MRPVSVAGKDHQQVFAVVTVGNADRIAVILEMDFVVAFPAINVATDEIAGLQYEEIIAASAINYNTTHQAFRNTGERNDYAVDLFDDFKCRYDTWRIFGDKYVIARVGSVYLKVLVW